MRPTTKANKTDGEKIKVTITPERGDTITGWPEAAEDLDLLGPGPREAHGIKATKEIAEYHKPNDEYPYGYSQVILLFENEETLEWAHEHLYKKATERFEGGAAGAEDVQKFADSLPCLEEISEK